MSDFILNIIDDEQEGSTPQEISSDTWKIAIIDDEIDVHEVTKLALRDAVILNKKLHFIHAYSGEEGFELLKNNPDCAVVLLDVVMENDQAGLDVVQKVRGESSLDNLQIILRTGQPGYAPEEKIIIDYEINDYKTKNELTREKLFTCLATGLRSYQHLKTLADSKQGLRNVIDASADLLKERSVNDFSSGVLQQINALFNLNSHGIFCVSQWPLSGPIELERSNNNAYVIVAASKKYSDFYGKDIEKVTENEASSLAQKALTEKRHLVEHNISAIYLSTPSHWEGVVVMEGSLDFDKVDEELLKVFCINIALGLENAKFFTHLNRAAYVDELTGLFNRSGLIAQVKKAHHLAQKSMSLYIVDIDYFHEIIESLGYDFGNEVLQAMTSTLNRVFSKEAFIARLHSDVFAVLVPDSEWQVNTLAKECSKPFIINNNSIRMGVTLGEASCQLSTGIADVEQLLRHAEIALKVAKENKRGMGQIFEPKFENDKRNRLDMLADLRKGLSQEELFLVLQPKVSMKSNEVVGYEALIRWQHPTKGVVPPNAFIPIAEQSGLYFDLDLYVANQAIKLLEKYPEINKPISINISANSLNHLDFLEELAAITNLHPQAVERLEIEITENALVRSDTAIQHLNDLKEMGFTLCLDDFGAGYSSLAYLLKLPLDIIKIDRSFVHYLATDEKSRAVLKGMLDICKNLNKKVVVEGVEDQDQVDILIAENVDVAQGFFYFKPMPINEILLKAL